MVRCLRVIVLGLAAIGWLGCSSSEQGGDEASMDDMAAMLSQPQAPTSSTDEVGIAERTDPAERAAQPDKESVAPSAAAPDPNLTSRRGFALQDLSDEIGYVMVKADVVKVADAVAKLVKGQVVKDSLGKNPIAEDSGTIVFQLAGHPWSIVALWPDEGFNEQAATLSRELGTDVMTYASSDFNGWSFVVLYRGGEPVEALDWGGEGDELGEDGDDSKWDSQATIPLTGEDIDLNERFLFRSTLRKVTEQDLQQGEGFVDWLFKQHDAYLPDAEDMPWLGENGIESPLGAAAFAGVHAVIVSE